MIYIDGISYPNASVTITTNAVPAPGPTPVPGPAPAPAPPPAPLPGNGVPVPWNSPTRITATFAPDGAASFVFTAPSTPSLCQVVVAQYEGGYADMAYALSSSPNDFVGLPFDLARGQGGVTVQFWVGATPPPPPMAGMDNYYVVVPLGAQLYLNVKNAPGNGVTGSRVVYCELSQHAV